MKWQNILKGKLRFNEPLSLHTTFKLGGKVKAWVEPKDLGDLRLLLIIIKDRFKLPFVVIGRGSNILARDGFIKAVAVSLNSSYFKSIESRDADILVGGGTPLSKLINFAKHFSLGGTEFLSGIPGTVGGALIMNAGVKNKNIGDITRQVLVMDKHAKLKIIKGEDLKFGYRYSNLFKYIILKAKLRLEKKNKDAIEDDIRSFMEYRKKTQDLSYPSAGCIFKNPNNQSAGKLIDLCGLKGRRIGDAQVSKIHANFIINRGNAKASDVRRLMQLIQKRVKHKFGIWLEPEIKIL